ncbi:hypothetical protein CYMTET_53566 [Cymbomonas tetramitiformis]|uniref:Uncharacterized protein n=1 Tax=Cymbomonas tetramitiformis TaxID=36881 RepID=A0AAE0BIG8_9CHLO|nr:hypothetical protein CYMTET_53566 [Cymbomonas tetramitiformis]
MRRTPSFLQRRTTRGADLAGTPSGRETDRLLSLTNQRRLLLWTLAQQHIQEMKMELQEMGGLLELIAYEGALYASPGSCRMNALLSILRPHTNPRALSPSPQAPRTSRAAPHPSRTCLHDSKSLVWHLSCF